MLQITFRDDSVIEVDASNIRVEDGAFAYDVKGKTRTHALADVAHYRLPRSRGRRGARMVFGSDPVKDGPLHPIP